MRVSLAGCIALAMLVASMSVSVAQQDSPRSDVCFEVESSALPTGAWASILDSVDTAIAERSILFGGSTFVHASADAPARFDITTRPVAEGEPVDGGDCLVSGAAWTMRVGRSFLQEGADRLLEVAPTTPGIDSEVTVEWYPDEDRVQTTLVFAGPLDIPNGTCWIDDALTIDAATGSATSSAEQGVKTSIFAEGACNRFFDHLPDGGAGEQATTLLPSQVALEDGSTVHFLVSSVGVEEDAVVLQGSVEIR